VTATTPTVGLLAMCDKLHCSSGDASTCDKLQACSCSSDCETSEQCRANGVCWTPYRPVSVKYCSKCVWTLVQSVCCDLSRKSGKR